MEAFKSIFTSKVIITNIVTTVATLAAVWGLNLSPEVQATAVTVIVTLGTLVFSSAFRVSSTQQLTPSPTVAKVANEVVAEGTEPRLALKAAKRAVSRKKAGAA